ncbi:YqaA family protein [Roseomonas sp. AR75]|uniref:YqaA family protein n=1 Tax=Roseomonas sp. AR75 TaxID=2562311 RepID=UPI0010BFED36|nr:YqaA family protein [Roseomonas sp. AR75]
MLHALYARVMDLAQRPQARFWLGAVSFAESSIFPIPPDAMLVPMALARPDQAWKLATICTVASVLGGVVGYALGFFLFELVAQPVLTAYGYADALIRFEDWFQRWGAAVILIKGLTPIPFKIVTIAAGAAKMDFATFLLTSLVTRAARFFLLAGLIRRFGPAVRDFIERRLVLVTSTAAALVILGFLALRYV